MSSSLHKSTIVRIRNRSTRSLFRAGELLAPRLGGRVVRNLWFTVPPLAPDTPLPPGGEPFSVTSLGAEVRGHAWGEGPSSTWCTAGPDGAASSPGSSPR